MKWELIEETRMTVCDRLRVPGGWIVRTRIFAQAFNGGSAVHQIFVSDSNRAGLTPIEGW